MNEKQLQKAVIDLAHLHGWRVAHFKTAPTQSGRWATPVQADGKGFPDLVMVRVPRLLFVELKAKGKRLRPEQEAWLEVLRLVSRASRARDDIREDLKLPAGASIVEVHVWNPTDWQTDFIERTLK